MSVSVVVLSYERPHLLRQALPTIVAQQPAPAEVLVVDNPSRRSGEVDAVLRDFPAARLIRPERNLGFAAGMNRGLAAATGDDVFLTEDDLLLEPGVLATLGGHMAAQPSCGLSGGVMLNHETGTIRSAGIRVTLGGLFRQTVLHAGEDPGHLPPAPYAVDVIPGAGVYARRRQLLELGGFRAPFFMYYEDVELAARVRRAGLTVDVVPAARVRHFEPPPGAPSALLEFHKMKNLAATYLLHAPVRVWPEFVARFGMAVPLRTLARSPALGWAHGRAWLWVLSRLPALLIERFTRRAGAAVRNATPVGPG